MISNEAKQLIENNPIAISTCVFGNPNISVAAFVKVVEEDKIVITDNYMAKTISNLEKNNKIELAVWNKDWLGYKITGKARYETLGKWLDFVKNMKENEGLPTKGAIVVTVSEVRKIGD